MHISQFSDGDHTMQNASLIGDPAAAAAQTHVARNPHLSSILSVVILSVVGPAALCHGRRQSYVLAATLPIAAARCVIRQIPFHCSHRRGQHPPLSAQIGESVLALGDTCICRLRQPTTGCTLASGATVAYLFILQWLARTFLPTTRKYFNSQPMRFGRTNASRLGVKPLAGRC